MAINYGFFPYLAGSSPHDRSYTTILWAKFFSWLFPHEGVVSGIGNNLAITASGTPDMYVHINTGAVIAQGFYWLENTASYPVPITAADADDPRIDLIVAKFRLTGDTYRDAILTTHDGTPAASPTAPTPTVSADVVEIVLGQVTVAAGATQILTANITAAASQPLCGFVGAKFGKAFVGTDGSIDAASLPIHHVANPTSAQDAVTKNYGDTTYALLASPAFTGNPTVPTQTAGNNSTRAASTAFVKTACGAVIPAITAGDCVIWILNPSFDPWTTSGGSYQNTDITSDYPWARFKAARAGTYRVGAWCKVNSSYGYFNISKNGSNVARIEVTSTSYALVYSDLTLAAGDVLTFGKEAASTTLTGTAIQISVANGCYY